MRNLSEVMQSSQMGEKKILCVISARGGSKNIPQKNLQVLNGMP